MVVWYQNIGWFNVSMNDRQLCVQIVEGANNLKFEKNISWKRFKNLLEEKQDINY